MKNICYLTCVIFFWLCGVAFASGQESDWFEASLGFLMLFGMAWLCKMLIFGPTSRSLHTKKLPKRGRAPKEIQATRQAYRVGNAEEKEYRHREHASCHGESLLQ